MALTALEHACVERFITAWDAVKQTCIALLRFHRTYRQASLCGQNLGCLFLPTFWRNLPTGDWVDNYRSVSPLFPATLAFRPPHNVLAVP